MIVPSRFTLVLARFLPTGAVLALFGIKKVFAYSPPLPAASLVPSTEVNEIVEFYNIICVTTQWFLVFGLIIGVLFVIWGGIKYVTSHGDSTSESDAKKIIRNAMIGVAFLILAVALVRIVASFFGATGFSLSSASCSL